MRVGIVCPYSLSVPGGVQSHVLGLAGWLAGRGHAVSVLAPGRWRGPLPVGVELVSLGRAVPVPWNGSVSRVAMGPLTWVRVGRWLARGFDVVHLHEPITPSAAYLALARADAPVVSTHHCASAPAWPFRVGCLPVRRQLMAASASVAVSPAARRLAERYLPGPVPVVPNGVAVTAGARPAGGPTVTFLGRDEPRKGLDVFLAAVPLVRGLAPGARLAVAGNRRRGLPAGVTGLGPLSEPERAHLLARTDVLVAPQLGAESFGLVVAEALAAGARVVASDLPAFRDAFGDGGAVTYFPAGDATELARAVVEALQAPAPADPRDAVARYSWDVVGPQVEALYAEAAAGPRR